MASAPVRARDRQVVEAAPGATRDAGEQSRQGPTGDQADAREGRPAHTARGCRADRRRGHRAVLVDPPPHHRPCGDLRHRMPRPGPRQDDLPGPARRLARRASAVRPRRGALRARTPLPARVRPGEGPRLRLLVRSGAARGEEGARENRKRAQREPPRRRHPAFSEGEAEPPPRVRPGPPARCLRHLHARLPRPGLRGAARGNGRGQGGRWRLDPAGDRPRRSRDRGLALDPLGRRDRDLPQSAQAPLRRGAEGNRRRGRRHRPLRRPPGESWRATRPDSIPRR